MDRSLLTLYLLVLLGLTLLLLNHLFIVQGHLWLIPSFLRIV